jgi:predicted N-formylglutamate amidohydrolase
VPPFRILCPNGAGKFVILCDHASNHVPAELKDLGLLGVDLARHIAWDIGAAGVAGTLSEKFDAPAVLSNVSRLVIDCNRHPGALDLIPEKSDGTSIPGNQSLTEDARASRLDRWFTPYHDAIESILDARAERGLSSFVLSIHSMTECLGAVARPWKISLSSYQDRSIVEPVLKILRRIHGEEVGDNQPYDLDPSVDYSVPTHAMRRRLPYLQVEFRQDEVRDAAAQRAWAHRFASALLDAGLG